MASDRRCAECRAELVFMRNAKTGKLMPLQKVTTVYHEVADGKVDLVAKAKPRRPFYVSHFQTCPNPGRFTRSE